MGNRRWAAALAFALALVAACHDDPSSSTPATHLPPPAPLPTLRVDSARVWVQAPGPDWQLLDGAAAAALHAGAVAAWRQGPNCYGWVETMPAAGRSRETIANAARAKAELAGGDLISDEAFLFGPTRTAWRWELWKPGPDGQKRAERAVIVTEGDQAWVVHARGQASIHGIVRSCLDSVMASFETLPAP